MNDTSKLLIVLLASLLFPNICQAQATLSGMHYLANPEIRPAVCVDLNGAGIRSSCRSGVYQPYALPATGVRYDMHAEPANRDRQRG